MSQGVQEFRLRGRSQAQAQDEGPRLVWPTPVRELLANPNGGDYVRIRLPYVFELSDSRELKVAPVALTSEEREPRSESAPCLPRPATSSRPLAAVLSEAGQDLGGRASLLRRSGSCQYAEGSLSATEVDVEPGA